MAKGSKKWTRTCPACGAKMRKKFGNILVTKDGRTYLVGMSFLKCRDKKCNHTLMIKKEKKKAWKEVDKQELLAIEYEKQLEAQEGVKPDGNEQEHEQE